ncbi:hypothetical protein RSAG8_00834, partial [Rhizoctonia solani AG-8 WAC10335]
MINLRRTRQVGRWFSLLG